MPRTTPVEFRQLAYEETTGDGSIDLIVIDHPDLAAPLRFARNGEDLVSNGETYTGTWFDIVAPELSSDGGFTEARLQVDAVDQVMILALRSIAGPATLEHTLVLISDPDNVTHGPWNYQVRGEQSYNQSALNLRLTFEPVLMEQCPWKRLSPSRAPGLY